MSSIQSIVFRRELWTVADAKIWLRKHKFTSGKHDLTQNTIRFRQRMPRQFKDFRMLVLPKGIRFTLGFKKKL